ncbi:DUF4149 domain-containing protein [Piscinibacter sakaiensis]|uniref:DUF4149 domain-containing protein n=1 Tax=Piscinibacter sakaiensis TaxID=1547922 RepID=UPI003AAFCBEE
MAARAAALLAGVWAGALLALAAIAAPLAFANAARDVAGRIAGQTFALEARVGLLIAVVLLLLLRRQARPTGAPVFSTDLMLLLGAVFCTVAGHFALQPMLAAARAGEGSLSFAALHGIAAAFYGVKTLLVLVLAWRLVGTPRAAATSVIPPLSS